MCDQASCTAPARHQEQEYQSSWTEIDGSNGYYFDNARVLANHAKAALVRVRSATQPKKLSRLIQGLRHHRGVSLKQECMKALCA